MSDRRAEDRMVGAFAICLPDLLIDVEKPIVPAQPFGAHLKPFKRAQAAAIAHTYTGHGQAPAIAAQRLHQTRAHPHGEAAQIIKHQGTAIVQLQELIDVPRPDPVVRDMGVIEL